MAFVPNSQVLLASLEVREVFQSVFKVDPVGSPSLFNTRSE